jgi:hypothetical protein
MSTVFGPTIWTVPGRSLPVYNVTGNHGSTAGGVQLLNRIANAVKIAFWHDRAP